MVVDRAAGASPTDAPLPLTATITPSTVTSLSVEVGDSCLVRWRDGSQTLKAKILARRQLKRRKTDPETTTDELAKLKPDEIQYYVHYVDHDRRLDEWVTFDKFLLDSLNRLDKNEPDKEPAVSTSSAAPVHGAVVSDLGVGKTIGSAGSKSIGSSAGGASKAIVNSAGGASKSGRRYRSSLGGKLPQPPPSAENLDQSPPNADASSFSLTGGNWHGIGGDPALAALEREHEETTRLKNIQKIVMGGWEIEAWYYSPYPGKYGQAETLYVCEYCLKYMRKQTTFRRHVSSCLVREPPGTEIYRDGRLSVYEIDGKEQRCYCQLLCLLAKLYIDHKTLYYDVDPFYFYVVTEVDEFGSHIVGYFSKEKVSAEDYNLACILIFPHFQQNGYGKFIISLSYELTKIEKKTGSPEKPLSDLGKISYRSYWTHVLMHYLAERDPTKDDMSLKEMSLATGIKTEDIISTLQSLDMVMCWKGQHVIFVKQDAIQQYLQQEKPFRICKPECLVWVPHSQRALEGENKENI